MLDDRSVSSLPAFDDVYVAVACLHLYATTSACCAGSLRDDLRQRKLD